jgi:hypothetical protein
LASTILHHTIAAMAVAVIIPTPEIVSMLTTLFSYGTVPEGRQREIIAEFRPATTG